MTTLGCIARWHSEIGERFIVQLDSVFNAASLEDVANGGVVQKVAHQGMNMF